MRRELEKELLLWKKEASPMPIILRGARQVGKSFLIQSFGKKNFQNFIEMNLETDRKFLNCFSKNHNLEEMISAIEINSGKRIELGKTLIFIDEIQESPEALKALRILYEKFPGLHVIAAGSLLEFLLNSGEISVPVGRVQYWYLQAMSFYEFLLGRGGELKLEYIKNLDLKTKQIDSVHNEILNDLKIYMLTGGMPKAIVKYIETGSILEAFKIQASLIATYKDDFGKYAKYSELEDLQEVLIKTPKQVGKKFKYSNINREVKSTKIKNAFKLLEKANLIYKIKASSGAGLPLEAQASDSDYKALFLDIGLMQNILGINEEIISAEDYHSIASGALAEQFVGQEILTKLPHYQERALYYWEKNGRSDAAEVDYLLSAASQVIPVEVKAGKRGKLKSLMSFMQQYNSRIGVRIYQGKLDYEDKILSVPLYAVPEINRLL